MRTAVAETSIQAYREIQAEGVLTAQQKTLMLALHANWAPGRTWSLQEIVILTGLPINVVSGRVNELKTERPRYLEEVAKRRCSVTGRTVTPVTLRYPNVQKDLF